MILEEEKCIYIHIPKTGGSSIEFAFDQKTQEHETLEQTKEKIKNSYESYFSFSIVRNPFDRFVSTYFYLKEKEEAPYVEGMSFDDFVYMAKEWKANYSKSFVEFKKTRLSFEEYLKTLYLCPQTDWIVREGSLAINRVIYFDNLNEGFKDVCKKLKIKKFLPHRNKTNHKNYLHYYNKKTLSIIESVFEKDFIFFDHFKLRDKIYF